MPPRMQLPLLGRVRTGRFGATTWRATLHPIAGHSPQSRRPGLDPGARLPSTPADGLGATRRLGLHHGRPLSRYDVHRRHRQLAPEDFPASRRSGSEFFARYALPRLVWAERGETIQDCIAHEKPVKHWRREWKFALIERGDPDWVDLYSQLI